VFVDKVFNFIYDYFDVIAKKSSCVFLILLLVFSVIVLGNSQTTFALTPVADLTGQWSGFAQIINTEGTCEFAGKVNVQLTQNGNDIKGKYSFVQTSAKSSNPDVYYCNMESFGQDIHGTLDGSRITLYSEDSTFSGWYASSGINLDITSDGIVGKAQLSPVNFTPPSFTPKNTDNAKKKAAEEEKKKTEEAKKLKDAEVDKKRDALNQKKNNPVSDEKKTEVKTEKKKAPDLGNQPQNKIDTIQWAQASARVGDSGASISGKAKSAAILTADAFLKIVGKQTKPDAFALFSHYFGANGKPYEFKEIPTHWQDWIVKQLKDKKDGKYPLSPYNTGPPDLVPALGGFNVEVIKNSDGTRTYKISDTYNFDFTPDEIKKKTRHGINVDWSPRTIRYMNKFLATLGEYDYPDGKMKEKFEIKKQPNGNTLFLPQKYLIDNGVPFQVKGEFTR